MSLVGAERGMEMNRKLYVLMLVLSMIAGIIGGRLSGLMFIGEPALAQKVSSEKIIEAQEFRVVDDKGKLRAEFNLSDDGAVDLTLLDQDDIVRAKLSLAKDGCPSLLFFDQHGSNCAAFGVLLDQPCMVICDKEGKPAWSMP